MEFAIPWIVFSVLAGVFAYRRGFGFAFTLVISMALSPIVGFVSVFVRNPRPAADQRSTPDSGGPRNASVMRRDVASFLRDWMFRLFVLMLVIVLPVVFLFASPDSILQLDTLATLIATASVLAAIVQALAVYLRAASWLAAAPEPSFAKRWIWFTISVVAATAGILPFIGILGWGLGALLLLGVVPVGTVAMAFVAPVPWAWAATSVALMHLAGRVGLWLADAHLAQGDLQILTQVYIGNALVVVLVVIYENAKHARRFA